MNGSNRILIVDDDSQIRELLKMMLELDEGFICETAYCGAEALQKQAVDPVSLIVLDFMLPDLTGREVFQELRRRGDLVPVVFLSAQPDLVERMADLDHSGVLQKPFGIDELITTLRCALRA